MPQLCRELCSFIIIFILFCSPKTLHENISVCFILTWNAESVVVTNLLRANESHRLCLLCSCVKHLIRPFWSLGWSCGAKQKAGVPRPTPAEQENNQKFVSVSSVRGRGSSKLNENLPAITEPQGWGICFKRCHLNGRALLLAQQCLSVVMQYFPSPCKPCLSTFLQCSKDQVATGPPQNLWSTHPYISTSYL